MGRRMASPLPEGVVPGASILASVFEFIGHFVVLTLFGGFDFGALLMSLTQLKSS